jgi:hypothetical protein
MRRSFVNTLAIVGVSARMSLVSSGVVATLNVWPRLRLVDAIDQQRLAVNLERRSTDWRIGYVAGALLLAGGLVHLAGVVLLVGPGVLALSVYPDDELYLGNRRPCVTYCVF